MDARYDTIKGNKDNKLQAGSLKNRNSNWAKAFAKEPEFDIENKSCYSCIALKLSDENHFYCKMCFDFSNYIGHEVMK